MMQDRRCELRHIGVQKTWAAGAMIPPLPESRNRRTKTLRRAGRATTLCHSLVGKPRKKGDFAMAVNPYAAPAARVEDARPSTTSADFVPDGVKRGAGAGWRWLKAGPAPVRRHPWAWLGVALGLVLIALVLTIVPPPGMLLILLMPVLIAGLLIGTRAIDAGEPLRFTHLFAGFTGHPGRLITLGLIQLVGMLLILLATRWAGGNELERLIFSVTNGLAMPAVGSRSLLAIYLALLTPYMMASWFAPALIALDDQALGRSIKASFLACAKNWLPFTVYSALGMLIVGLTFGIVIALGAALYLALGTVALVAFVVIYVVGILILIPILMVTVYASYRDVFHPGSSIASPAP
jgi:hypothetical protein